MLHSSPDQSNQEEQSQKKSSNPNVIGIAAMKHLLGNLDATTQFYYIFVIKPESESFQIVDFCDST